MKSGTQFVITGTLKTGTRTFVSQLIRQAGGVVKSSISNSIEYLVVGDDPGDDKLTKADRYGIPCIKELELIKMLNEKDYATFDQIWKKVGKHFEADVSTIKAFKKKQMLASNAAGDYLIPNPDTFTNPMTGGIDQLAPDDFIYDGKVKGFHQWSYKSSKSGITHYLKEKV